MWKKVILSCGLLLFVAGRAWSVDNPVMKAGASSQEKAAITSADQWLAEVDNMRYAASWNTASQFFKLMVPREQWTIQIQDARSVFGNLVYRKLEGKKYAQDLPGAPDGEYYVLTYRAAYAEKAVAIETVTVRKEKDGRWHVAGYYIH